MRPDKGVRHMTKRGGQRLLGTLVRQLLMEHPAFDPNPLGDWAQLVGDEAARSSQPQSLKDRVLKVVVRDSAWKHHLDLKAHALLEKINSGRTPPLVEKVVFRVGELTAPTETLNPNSLLMEKLKAKRPAKRKAKSPVRKLSAAENDLIKRLSDQQLRRLCTQLLRRIPDDPRD
jgi:predicted nucleic acid-binding Zn ribbon protein